jgi:hypothetical protein
MSSTMIHGVSRDARRIVKAVAARARLARRDARPREARPEALPTSTSTSPAARARAAAGGSW